MKEFKLKHPMIIDNDFSYWRALETKYWPTFYLVDKQGIRRNVFIGETHYETAKEKRVEGAIERLLEE